ncbi:hypothetical protein Godav_024808, partial [Gossypium davidsonii]|nr:hypothetical protein [Gossypium davidsonii]
KKPPSGICNKGHDSDCCKEGKFYNTYTCSPLVSSHTKEILTLNGFGPKEDSGGPCECDNNCHKDSELIVALSTGWFNKKKTGVMMNTITSLRVPITLSMPQTEFGMPWECMEIN